MLVDPDGLRREPGWAEVFGWALDGEWIALDQAQTDRAGQFAFLVGPGDHRVDVVSTPPSLKEPPRVLATAYVAVAPGQDSEIVLTLPR